MGDFAGVVRRSVEGALRAPAFFDGVRGVGVLEGVGRTVAVGGRALAEDDDFEGDEGVLVGLDGGADGRDVEAIGRGLIAGAGAGTMAGAGADESFGVGPSPSAVGGITLGGAEVSGGGAGGVVSCTGAASLDARAGAANVVLRKVARDVRGLVAVPFVLPFVLTGGHSRAMRCSSFTESPVLLEAALVVRDDVPGGTG